MPVTTRLQARLALEAGAAAQTTPSSPSERSDRSAAPSPEPSPVLSSPPRCIRGLALPDTVHGRHTSQDDITPSSPFPNPEPVYGRDEEDYDLGLDLPDYLSDIDYAESPSYPALPGASPARPSSSATRGMKRKYDPSSPPLPSITTFLKDLLVGTMPTIRSTLDPTIHSSSSSLKRIKLEPLSSPPSLPPIIPVATPKPEPETEAQFNIRHQRLTIQRLRNTYTLLASHPSTPSPVLELPAKETYWYDQLQHGAFGLEEPEDPDWEGVKGVHGSWRGSGSPKVSPTSNGDTLYAIGARGKRRKLEQIRWEMRVE